VHNRSQPNTPGTMPGSAFSGVWFVKTLVGAVVEVEFDADNLPPILNALRYKILVVVVSSSRSTGTRADEEVCNESPSAECR
jgi:hypothetical protein